MVKKNKSIRIKLIYSIVSIILFAFFLLSIYNYKSSEFAFLYRITNYELPYYSDKAKLTISQLIHDGTNSLDIMSNDAYFIDLISNATNRNDEINEYLKKRQSDNKDLVIGFISEESNSFYSVNSQPGEVTQENSKWYFTFKEYKGDRAFNVNQSSKTKQIKLWIQQKEYDENGKFLGVAYVGFNIEKVTQFVLSQNFGNKGETMLVGMDGGIKIHKDSAVIDYNNTQEEGHTFSTVYKLGDKANKLITKQDYSTKYTRSDGDERILTTRYIPELDWVMIIDVSKDQLIEPLKETFIKTIIGSIIISFFIILVVSFLLNRIAIKPILKMSDFVKSFSEGDLKKEISVFSEDEIG